MESHTKAFDEVFVKTSTKHAPWYIITSNHKWFPNLAVSQVVAETMEDLGMQMPEPQVDLGMIRKECHQAATDQRPEQSRRGGHKGEESRRQESSVSVEEGELI